MVYRGRSAGCITCKQRRVKCDEDKPSCSTCLRLGLFCGGYKAATAPKITFRDETHKFTHGAKDDAVKLRTRHHKQNIAISPPTISEPDSAVPFFLMHFARMGRDFGSTRGFFETLVPVYCSETQNSALSLAVSVVSRTMFSFWQHRPDGFQPLKIQAIRRLRAAVNDPKERGMPATLLAVLVLEFYEKIVAVYESRHFQDTHHQGAMSLVPFADSDRTNRTVSAYMTRYTAHNEIAMAIRQKRPPQPSAISWLGGKDVVAAPINPSSELDAIAASVAELQTIFLGVFNADGSMMPSSVLALKRCRAEAEVIEQRLLIWQRNVPDHWLPLGLASGLEVDASVPTYGRVCDIYPSCQVATIWNMWRIQRILIARIAMVSLCLSPDDLSPDENDWESSDSQGSGQLLEYSEWEQVVQTMVDSICNSVPFYLGNRDKASSLHDFSDPNIMLPSYDFVSRGDKVQSFITTINKISSRDEHRRHLIAQGPWHAMDPLSQLLVTFLEDRGGVIVSMLRQGQREWIQEQFHRVMRLLTLQPEDSFSSMDRIALTERMAQNIAMVV